MVVSPFPSIKKWLFGVPPGRYSKLWGKRKFSMMKKLRLGCGKLAALNQAHGKTMPFGGGWTWIAHVGFKWAMKNGWLRIAAVGGWTSKPVNSRLYYTKSKMGGLFHKPWNKDVFLNQPGFNGKFGKFFGAFVALSCFIRWWFFSDFLPPNLGFLPIWSITLGGGSHGPTLGVPWSFLVCTGLKPSFILRYSP